MTASPTIRAFADAMRPPSRLPVTEWCERNVVLPHSNKSPRWDIAGSPWLREPMLAAADNRNREIVLVAPTGSGKTTFFEGLIPYAICEAPGNVLYITQTDAEAADWAETRLLPSLKLCRSLDGLWPKDRHKTRKTEIIFPHMALFCGGAGIANLQEKSVRWVMLDEAWTYKTGRIQMARRRTHDGWNARVCVLSQGGIQGGDLHTAWEQTDMAEYRFPCPGCGAVKPWRFSELKWEDARTENGKRDWNAIAASVRLECECGHVVPDRSEQRRALSSSGVYVAMNGNCIPRHRGYTYNAMAVWWASWFDLVAEFLKACEEKERANLEPLKLFHMQRMADFWRDEQIESRATLVGSGYSKGQYVHGERIDNEVRRFLTIDKQRDHFWGVVRAWRGDGSSRLCYEGKILTWETIETIRMQYQVEPQFVFVDARFDTGSVYDNCGTRNWTALHGSGEPGFVWRQNNRKVTRSYSQVSEAQAPNGKRARYVIWSNERIKDALILLRIGRGMSWEIPDDVSDDYIRQIDAEQKIPTTNAKTGETRDIWVRIRKRDNHLWDCECMQVAVAMMMRIMGDTESAAKEDVE